MTSSVFYLEILKNMRYEAIIWDCDGVLIDSEVPACSAIVEILAELGYKISLEDYFNRFVGKGITQLFFEIKQETGIQLEKKFSSDLLFVKQKEFFNKSLQETDGIRDVLDALNIPMAVASGSNFKRLCYTLEITNLIDYFNGHIYSSEMVKKGKPAPDIFLYAAEKLNVSPEKCLVIEDSIHGINAAKAAGMDVYTYLGGSHITQKMQKILINMEVQAALFHMQELLPLFYKKAVG